MLVIRSSTHACWPLQPLCPSLSILTHLHWHLQVAGFKATIDSACCEAIESAKEVLATLATTWQAEFQENDVSLVLRSLDDP